MSGRPLIVYVLRHYPQLSQTFVRNEIAGLRDLGQDVKVISLKESDTEHVDAAWAGSFARWPTVGVVEGLRALSWWALRHPVRTTRLLAAARTMGLPDRRRLTLLEVPVVARRLVGDGRVAAVHTHFAWPVSLEPAILLARLLGVPSSVTTHARDIYLPAPGLPLLLTLVDRMVTVCRYNVGELRRTGLWPAGRPEPSVIPCGVELPTDPGRSPASTLSVVSVGRLVDKKGFDDLIAAMVDVVSEVPNARLDIIGDGPQRGALERQIVDRGLQEVVTLRGAAAHARVLEAISQAGVFALACRVDSDGDSDAMPVVLREAMARSVPVVTTDVAGIGENVDHSTGWLVAPQDVRALSAALIDALARPDEAARRGSAARATVPGVGATARAMTELLDDRR